MHIGWSWFLLAAVITLFWGQSNRGAIGFAGYAVGAGYALVLLSAVLVHEGAHALTARRLGIPVHRVVADFLGGHTAFESTGLTPGRAAAIAASGPGANAALGVLAWLLLQIIDAPLPALILVGVAWINLLLAGFNLLPGLPLDGGQLVEAAVWGATGRRSKGMIAAGWGGRLVTLAIVLWVLVRPLLAGRTPDTFSLIWAVLLVSVIWRGASAAIAVGRSRGMLEGVTVGQAAQPVRVVSATATVGALEGSTSGVVTLATDPTGGVLWVSSTTADLSSVPPHTPLSAVSTVVPQAAVSAARPDDELWDVLTRMHLGGAGVVLLADDRGVWGAITAEHLDSILPRLAR